MGLDILNTKYYDKHMDTQLFFNAGRAPRLIRSAQAHRFRMGKHLRKHRIFAGIGQNPLHTEDNKGGHPGKNEC